MQAKRKLISFIGLGSYGVADALYDYLKAHPEVYVPHEQTNFFYDLSVYKQGIDWYEKHFSKHKAGQKCGELTNNYIFSTPAIALMSRIYPDAKLFAVIENPLVMVRIAYIEAKRAGKISETETLAFFLKKHPEVLTRYCFGRQLSQYFSYYSHNDLLVLTASDVKDDPLKTTTSLYEYLELNNKFVPLSLVHLVPEDEADPKKRPNIIKRSFKFIFRIFKRIYTFFVSKFKKPKLPVDSILIQAEAISISPELEKFLKEYYREDITVLSRLLHRDLIVEWNF